MIEYLQHIPELHRTLLLAGGLCIFWLIETFFPLFSFTYHKWKHAGVNLFFTLTTIVVNFAFAVIIVATSDWCIRHHFGILQWIQLPLVVRLLAGLLILDFIGAWLIHYIEHKLKWMWKFHMIHHADRHVDTTTANRHHPVESLFRAVFTWLAVMLTGVPVWIVIVYQSLSVLLSQFNHANIKMPARLDSFLRLMLVTPNMHRSHHHLSTPETNSNFGNIFPFWDKIFRTYRITDMNRIQYGLDVLEGINDENVLTQLRIPFNPEIKTES